MVSVKLLTLISIICFLKNIHAYKTLPSYIIPCNRSDPEFNSCGLRHGEDAIPSIINGDPQYRIPNLNPFKLDRVSLETNNNLKLYATNISIYGLDKIKMKGFNWDFDNKKVFVLLHTPEIRIIGTYNLDGKILIMSLKGSGPMNNSHTDVNITAEVHYNIEERHNKEYLKIITFEVDLMFATTSFNFDNLLNNPQLSEQMNRFLNENSKILLEDLYPPIKRVWSSVILSIVTPLANKVPYDDIASP